MNRSGIPAQYLALRFDFQLDLGAEAKLIDRSTPWTLPGVDAAGTSVLFDFADHAVPPRSTGAFSLVEAVTLDVAPAGKPLEWQNDYSLSEMYLLRVPHMTQRVQIADSAGKLIYGWVPQ